ncbi:hypothetical protein GGI07_004313 [Coemansia sp. Benny D115]|nr:hypothetical protein GGI07_004313 [Coemansia sp. Benny D115]
MKAEPESRIVKGIDVKFSIDDLRSMKNSTSQWDGVRNYEARNIMRDQMKVGDRVLFYHSNCKSPGIAGTATIARSAYPDYTAFDPNHPYYDPKSNKESPRWFMVNLFVNEAGLAQSVERRTLNPKVAGSTPAFGSLSCFNSFKN